MTEISACILLEQLKNLDDELLRRKLIVSKLKDKCHNNYLQFGKTREKATHSYYVLPFHYNEKLAKVSRKKFTEAVCAELQPDKYNINISLSRGVPFWAGYVNPLYKFPIFNYDIKLPNAEYYHDNELIITLMQGFDLNDNDINDIAKAINKVCDNLDELK
jgi:dTDP-4-amino-4,6-dideoxygalactose transaminase